MFICLKILMEHMSLCLKLEVLGGKGPSAYGPGGGVAGMAKGIQGDMGAFRSTRRRWIRFC